MSIDRIDAYKALAAQVIPSRRALHDVQVLRGGVPVCCISAEVGLCGFQALALYNGDYWPIRMDNPAIGPYIETQEEGA